MSEAQRSYGSGTICIGMLSIPVKLYTATSASTLGFKMLHKGCGAPVNQALICSKHPLKFLDRKTEIIRGFESAPDQFVTFTDEEIKALETARPAACDIIEFVPKRTLDPLYIEKNIYLGPDKGAARPFALIAETLEKVERIGVGSFCQKSGKDTLVALRPYKGGLVLSECFFAEEVRPFVQGLDGCDWKFTGQEQRLAVQVVKSRANENFDASRFRDTWRSRVMAAVEEKVRGEEISIVPATQNGVVEDLVEALRLSIPVPKKPRGRAA